MREEPLSSTAETTRTQQNGWQGWALGLLAVPVVYLLTAPPLYYGMTSGWGTRIFADEPWAVRYHAPYAWLKSNALLAPALNSYSQWWWTFFLGKTAEYIEETTGKPAM